MAHENNMSVTPKPRTPKREVSVEAIKQRAYELFEVRGSSARPDRRSKTGSRPNASCTQKEASSEGAAASRSHSVEGGLSPRREPLGTMTA
jgi:hypothetical protein